MIPVFPTTENTILDGIIAQYTGAFSLNLQTLPAFLKTRDLCPDSFAPPNILTKSQYHYIDFHVFKELFLLRVCRFFLSHQII